MGEKAGEEEEEQEEEEEKERNEEKEEEKEEERHVTTNVSDNQNGGLGINEKNTHPNSKWKFFFLFFTRLAKRKKCKDM